MKIISIINQKGGVGKSSTALAVGAGLKLKGYKVLFIDLDPQGNLSYTLQADTAGYGALGILQRPETVKEEIQQTAEGDAVASSPLLAGADNSITQTGKEYRLKEALNLVSEDYDYCIIDTAPALGILTINALTACTGAIIPAQADIYSLQGIGQLYSTIEAVKKYTNPTLEVLGIVITRYNKRTIIGREVAGVLEDTARSLRTQLYKTKIREGIALVESQAERENIYKYASRSNVAKDYKALVDEIIKQQEANNGQEEL